MRPWCSDRRADDGRLFVHGEIDEHVADDFLAALDDPAVTAVDLTAVTFIDSSGLRSLLIARAARLEDGTTLTICGVSPAVARLLDVAGLRDVLDPAASEASTGHVPSGPDSRHRLGST